MKGPKRIMVDMSATLLHHGHINLLRKASDIGSVIVGLTKDSQILQCKGYIPELCYEHRAEILRSIKYVSEVVEVDWMVDDATLIKHKIDYLVHGDDNSNPIDPAKLISFPRTTGISSTQLRESSLRSIFSVRNKRLFLTPGPAAIIPENALGLYPVFGRADQNFQDVQKIVIDWLKSLSGQDEIISLQGSATLALEIALKSFVSGKVLLVNTGYYSNRLKSLLNPDVCIDEINSDQLNSHEGNYDWILCTYTETSTAFKHDASVLLQAKSNFQSKLFMDATGSIGLESQHEIADVLAFSSCKGLLGLTGASFIGFKSGLNKINNSSFYLDIDTHIQRKVTGPYHIIATLAEIMKVHHIYHERIIQSKKNLLLADQSLDYIPDHEPLLCTKLKKKFNLPLGAVPYHPRVPSDQQIVCHLGELDIPSPTIHNHIY